MEARARGEDADVGVSEVVLPAGGSLDVMLLSPSASTGGSLAASTRAGEASWSGGGPRPNQLFFGFEMGADDREVGGSSAVEPEVADMTGADSGDGAAGSNLSEDLAFLTVDEGSTASSASERGGGSR